MQYNNQVIKDNLFLFTSGSVNVSDSVKLAICKEDMCPNVVGFNLKRVNFL